MLFSPIQSFEIVEVKEMDNRFKVPGSLFVQVRKGSFCIFESFSVHANACLFVPQPPRKKRASRNSSSYIRVHYHYMSNCCIPRFVFINNEKNVYIKISLILFSKRAQCLLLVWKRDGETFAQWGDIFLSHNFFLEPAGTNACILVQAVLSERSETRLIGCVSLVRTWFSASV